MTVLVHGPGAYPKPPYGSFAGKPAASTDSKNFVQVFTVYGPGGYSKSPYGNFAGKGGQAPIILGPPAVSKILPLDAAFGSATVTRFFQTGTILMVQPGEAIGVVVSAGIILDSSGLTQIVFTRPDGSVIVSSATIGSVNMPTGKGIFESGTYGISILSGAQVNQSGQWTCYLRNGTFSSDSTQFSIGLQ